VREEIERFSLRRLEERRIGVVKDNNPPMRVEAVNGVVKGRGLGRLSVRGLAKVRAVALLHAAAHNVWRGHRLAACAA